MPETRDRLGPREWLDGRRAGTATVEPKDLWRLAFRIVIAAVAVAGVAWFTVTLHHRLIQFLLAIVLATGLARLTDRLEEAGFPRWASVLTVYSGVVMLLIVAGLVIVPPIADAVDSLVNEAPAYGDRAIQTLRDFQERFPVLPPIDEQLADVVRRLTTEVGTIASQVLAVAQFALGVFRGFLSILLVLIISLYLILDRERIREYLLGFISESQREHVRIVTEGMARRTGGWLLGQAALMVIVGSMVYVVLRVLGVPYPAVLAVIAGAAEIVPVIGPIVAAIPAIVLAATQSIWLALAVVVAYTVIQQIESYLLTPRILGHAVKIHPLAVLIAVIVGTELFGIAGTLASVPVAAASAIVLDEIRAARSRRGGGDTAMEHAGADEAPVYEPESSGAEQPSGRERPLPAAAPALPTGREGTAVRGMREEEPAS